QVVVKAQVLTGGRGKAGGVKLANDPADAERKAREILGLDINGHVVHRLWIEQASEIAKEYYLSVTFDRSEKKPLFMLTTDGGLQRHADIAGMRDVEAADPLEAFAHEKGVTYVKLDGTVGILGNGAGLAMSTVDLVVVAGGRTANFCDLGGGGDAQGVVDALQVITSDDQVRSIFFNIFGGITRCDEVARGILTALDQMKIDLPIVVRLDGTNAEDGRRI